MESRLSKFLSNKMAYYKSNDIDKLQMQIK